MIAIDGRGSSGKTALLEYVRTLYTAFTYLHGDDYFHHIHDSTAWGEFDEQRFARDIIQPLQLGGYRCTAASTTRRASGASRIWATLSGHFVWSACI